MLRRPTLQQRLGAVALGLIMGLSSTASLAESPNPGWYGSINLGANFLSDTDNSALGPDVVTATPNPPVCSVPLVLGVCLGVLVPQPDTITVTPGAAFLFRTEFKPGPTGGINFGYGFSNGFRPEVGISYRSNEIKNISENNAVLTSTNGRAQSISAMANLWFDLINSSRFTPYFGLGIGATHAGYDGLQFTRGGDIFNVDDNDTALAYQAGLGLGFAFNPRLQMSLDYRFLASDNLSFGNSQSSFQGIDTEFENQSAFLTLRYSVGGGLLLDTDGDGIPDTNDRCPNTPVGTVVGRDGCPLDSDGDGVPDSADKCPNTPKGAPVGPRGCPLDSDRDGVADYKDKCPGTPPKTTVGPDGCPIDADGDGVTDANDKCPNTPAGTKVGPDGCPLDADGDGILDKNDKCLGTPPGVAVGPDGCPPDADGDGVPDYLDKCPNTEAGMKVGPDGCALDSDGDGIPDYMDECPRSPAGAKVLANGCALKGDCRTPRAGEQVDVNGCAVDKAFILKGVNFEFDSDRLTPEAKIILNQVAETLAAYPDINTEIAGHTDYLGTDAYNLGLSERRSISVKNYLSGRGVNAARMTPTGYGKSQPIDPGQTEEARALNRRVELRVLEEEAAN